VRRIYLDQMHWVSLSAAELGQSKGDPFQDALVLAKEAVASSNISLPLSSVHYMETANRRDWPSRSGLARIMARLSRWHTIAPQHVLIPPELDRGLRSVFGTSGPLRPLQPFGTGASFAFGRDIPAYRIPPEWQVPADLRWQLERSVTPVWEYFMLSGVPPNAERQLPGFDPEAHVRAAAQHAHEQEALRLQRTAQRFNAGEAADRLFAADVYTENLEAFNEACSRAGLPPSAVAEAGRPAMQALLEQVPTMYATARLRRHRHVASAKRLDSHDIYDLIALPTAIVYCDVVVTERQYAAAARSLKLDERFNTVVLYKLDELITHLI
jgi:hypothetical protein